MTRNQRGEIYRMAAENIFEEKEYFGCRALASASGININKMFELGKVFSDFFYTSDYPEFMMFYFMSDLYEKEPEYNGNSFWYNDDHNKKKECRILALLLSAEMCKDK